MHSGVFAEERVGAREGRESAGNKQHARTQLGVSVIIFWLFCGDQSVAQQLPATVIVVAC